MAVNKRLKKGSFGDQQAEAIADSFDIALTHVAQKSDIELLRKDMKALAAETKALAAETKASILMWVFGALVGVALLNFALLQFSLMNQEKYLISVIDKTAKAAAQEVMTSVKK